MKGGSGEAPRDEGLLAFVDAIEGVLRARRGAESVLPPRDFALVRGWYEAGMPLAAVLLAIDLGFEKDPRLSGLALVRRQVEALAAVGPRPQAAPVEAERLNLHELGERLQALRERLRELPGPVCAVPLLAVEELADLVAVAQRPNWDYLRERLRLVDETVAAVAVDALSADERAALRAAAERAADRHRGRVEERALEDAVTRLLRQQARERLRLPRVGVD